MDITAIKNTESGKNTMVGGYCLTLNSDNKVVKKEFERPVLKYDSELQMAVENAMACRALIGAIHNGTGQKFDSNETKYAEKSLTKILEGVMLDWTPDYTSEAIFGVETEFSPWIKYIEYYGMSFTGEPKVMGSSDNTTPFVGYSTAPTNQPTIILELGYRYSWIDLQSANHTKQGLNGNLLYACKDLQERAINKRNYGLYPDNESYGVVGIFSATGISRMITNGDVGNEGAVTTLADFNMLTATGVQNRDFLLNVIDVPFSFTGQGSAVPDVLAMPIKQANKIRKQVIDPANTNSQTVASAILEAGVKEIIAAPELSQVNKNGVKDALIALKRDTKLQVIKRQLPFTPFPFQQSWDNQFQGITYAGTGGIHQARKVMVLVKNVGTP